MVPPAVIDAMSSGIALGTRWLVLYMCLPPLRTSHPLRRVIIRSISRITHARYHRGHQACLETMLRGSAAWRHAGGPLLQQFRDSLDKLWRKHGSPPRMGKHLNHYRSDSS